LTTSSNSTRLDTQVQRGAAIDLDYKTDLGLNMMLRGHVQHGLCVAITDGTANSTLFFGSFQPGWSDAYLNKSGATATFTVETQAVAAAELAKLGMPELIFSKVPKKGMLMLKEQVLVSCEAAAYRFESGKPPRMLLKHQL
jgi:hypothetical protein